MKIFLCNGHAHSFFSCASTWRCTSLFQHRISCSWCNLTLVCPCSVWIYFVICTPLCFQRLCAHALFVITLSANNRSLMRGSSNLLPHPLRWEMRPCRTKCTLLFASKDQLHVPQSHISLRTYTYTLACVCTHTRVNIHKHAHTQSYRTYTSHTHLQHPLVSTHTAVSATAPQLLPKQLPWPTASTSSISISSKQVSVCSCNCTQAKMLNSEQLQVWS